MGKSQTEEKLAVECGYWDLFRYNPELKERGKNPFSLDSKEPDYGKFQEFLQGEVRYASLKKSFPEEAEALYAKTEADARIVVIPTSVCRRVLKTNLNALAA